jgi:two-component system phosphate regulon sensor histidine kinase PhoR
VIDNGPGIDPKYRRRIFRKFFRVPAGDVQGASGFGLGLSYVRKIVRAHHWKIKLESATGEGCKFILIIPEKDWNG